MCLNCESHNMPLSIDFDLIVLIGINFFFCYLTKFVNHTKRFQIELKRFGRSLGACLKV